MKKIIVLIMLTVLSLGGALDVLAIFPYTMTFFQSWKKIEIGTKATLKKIICTPNSIMVFSADSCFTSYNLKDWEKRLMPSYFGYPFLFKGHVYVYGKKGVYRSNDLGETWTLFSTVTPLGMAANENDIFATFPVDEGGEHSTYNSAVLKKSSDGINFESLFNFNYEVRSSTVEVGDSVVVVCNNGQNGIYQNVSYDYGQNFNLCKDCTSNYTMFLFNVSIAIKDGEFTIAGKNGHIGEMFMSSNNGKQNFYGSGGFYTSAEYYGRSYSSDKSYYMNEVWLAGYVQDTKTKKYNGNNPYSGIIRKGDDLGHIFYCPEPINVLAANDIFLAAGGDNGALYILIDDDTSPWLETDIPENKQTDISEGTLDVYQENENQVAFSSSEKDYFVYSSTGGLVEWGKSDNDKTILNTDKYETGIYIIKSGNKVAKFLK